MKKFDSREFENFKDVYPDKPRSRTLANEVAQKSLFTEFERKFLLSIHAQTSRGKTLSEKQIETIDSIYTKICES